MNEKEVGELRRRFRQDRTGISHVRGCYVNEAGEIISQFNQSLGVMTQEENEKILGLLKKTLSGGLGRNLMDIEFETRQVVDGPEHKLLMTLRDSELSDEQAVETFFQTVIASVALEGNYMILLAHDAYDVPYRGKDDRQLEDASEEVFSYIICAVCPVKQTKPALSYYIQESQFHNLSPDWVVSPPQVGFLFPAFDQRSTNLYGALYYTKSTQDVQEALVDAVFRAPPPMPAARQQESFQALLGGSLGEACSLSVAEGVREQLCGMIEEHKESRDPEPLTIQSGTMKQVLSTCGVEEERIQAFASRYEETFGPDAQLSPRNLVDTRQIQLATPDVAVKISPDRSDLVQTRIIDGVKYIMIRVEGELTVNGVEVNIQ